MQEYKLMLEFMVNHISPKSHQFQDYLEHGDKSQYADMFIQWEDIWPAGAVPYMQCCEGPALL